MWPSSHLPPNQWSFNPAAYQNIPNENVDWATLAQQWMKMKETIPLTNAGPLPPQAPQISKSSEGTTTKPTVAAPDQQSLNDIEGGEAPMDMDTKDDEAATPTVGLNAGTDWNQWNSWQSQWGWGWTGNAGTVPLGEKTPSATGIDSKVKSLSNDSISVKLPPMSTTQVPGSFNYNSIPGGIIPPLLLKTGGWSETAVTAKPELESWNRNDRTYTLVNQKSIPEPCSIIDAHKKKQLPAWIREGLNKMEREKQKKMERDRMFQEKNSNINYIFEEKAPAINNQVDIKIPVLEEDSDKESPYAVAQDRRSRTPSLERTVHQLRSVPPQEDKNAIRKTKDQIMEESMLQVRRILTQILLEVTESQVLMIAKEEFKKRKLVQQMTNHKVLTPFTGNLGLDAYGSECESSESDDDAGYGDENSDEELKILIEKKQRDFSLIEDKIEEEIENREQEEREMVQRDDKNDERNFVNISAVERGSEKRGNDNSRDRNNEAIEHESTDRKSEHDTNHRKDADSHSKKTKSMSHDNKINTNQNGQTYAESKNVRNEKGKRKPSKSTSSSSSSSLSSSSSSRDSSSDSESSSSHRSHDDRRRNRTKIDDRKRDDKRWRYRSRSRSRSRYRHNKSSSSRRSDRDQGSTRRSSVVRDRRSSSRKGSRDNSSKYSKRRNSTDSRSRRRSKSRDSRSSRYRRH